MLRSLQPDATLCARQSAVVGVVGFLDIPIVHMSVQWWRSLHQGPTFQLLKQPLLDGRMELALLVNVLALTLLFLFLLGQRLNLAGAEQRHEELLWEEARGV
jgi:heme exporter protein C